MKTSSELLQFSQNEKNDNTLLKRKCNNGYEFVISVFRAHRPIFMLPSQIPVFSDSLGTESVSARSINSKDSAYRIEGR